MKRRGNPKTQKAVHAAGTVCTLLFLNACGAASFSVGTNELAPAPPSPSIGQNSMKVTFYANDYYQITSPNSFNCAGDAKNYYDPLSGAEFSENPVTPSETVLPAFVNNVSVDLTDANHPSAKNLSYSCSYEATIGTPVPSPCASFDQYDFLGEWTTAPTNLQSNYGLSGSYTGFGTGYYTFQDFSGLCESEGPIASTDPTLSKEEAGGFYIDLNRAVLGANERLLLNLTYYPLSTNNTNPMGAAYQTDESSIVRVHLISTGQTTDSLQAALQGRHLTYADTSSFPEVAQNLAEFSPAVGQLVTEQVVVPLGLSSSIDRIRIERFTGSAILVEAAVFRMGYQ